ncbi:bifunctional 5-dehydro-2-deoxygluconokinase/5-dehydro-2-deoxyphosphogluconate aldolase [Pelagibius marinus]|uniref:bifunctional 5-dehydro-2-deoxygluconokinase/5-dehydro-2- deoxyphosphogluconate aldolase n=1 Tax=Pelagibius marinus TaxID=2762760 RepID=UPI001872FDD9|nr:5-dehydro-2-deoxygluconokinase [Pelagibius marinus]
MTKRSLDVICLGRSCVDLYGEQIGTRLEDVQTFAKYVGGCAANIAIGTSRLGLKSALITRVGDEQLGRYVVETLGREGVDTSQITVDPERLTALVFLAIRDRQNFPHIFYRDNCADMALREQHIDPAFIASARALVVTGTHFSQPGVDLASRAAIRAAKEAGTRVVFDIDYRPVIWGLVGHAEGEGRFVASAEVTQHLQSILPDCDLVIGTEEEIHIAGGITDTLSAVKNIRELTAATIVVKRGALGCVVFPEAIPDDLDAGVSVPGVEVEVFNTLGAGDGFMSGFLRGWLRDEDWQVCCRLANATGALVVSRHGCSPAIPTWAELSTFLSDPEGVTPIRENARLNHLHQATTRRQQWQEVRSLAFDHRAQLEDLAEKTGGDRNRLTTLKQLIARGAAQAANGDAGRGVIVDDRYGEAVLNGMSGNGWWVARPVEKPGSIPLEFEAGDNLGLALRTWPVDHVAKCLVFYHPDDDEGLRRLQEDRLAMLHEACRDTGHELLIEVIPPAGRPSDDTTLARALANIYARDIFPDWWKLPPPSPAAWRAIDSVIQAHDPYCAGVLLLGLNAPIETLKSGFDAAAGQPLCKGFAVGRSIFQAPAEAWLAGTASDELTVEAIAANYRKMLDLWQRRGRD